MTTNPDWLAQYVTATRRQRIPARDLKPRRCPDCQAQVLTGLSSDQLAITATIDPTPLSPVGEALAWLEDRRTYTLARHGDRYRLEHTRDRWQIRGEPAGEAKRPTYDVVADHACGQPLPAAASVHQPIRVAQGGADDEPPF